MGSLSTALCNKLLDHVLENVAYTPPSTVHLALHVGDPGETGANECNYTGYGVRPTIAFGTAGSPTLRRITQTAVAVAFPQCTGTGNNATHWGVWSAATGGEFMAGGLLTNPLNIVNGNTPSVGASQVAVYFDPGTTASITNYLVHKLLDQAFRNQPYTQPVISVALFTATSSDTTPGTEVANSNNYGRKLTPNWDTSVNGASQNTDLILFNTPSGSWGTVVSQALMDSNTHGAGNMLFYGNDVVDQTINANDTVQFVIGALDIALS